MMCRCEWGRTDFQREDDLIEMHCRAYAIHGIIKVWIGWFNSTMSSSLNFKVSTKMCAMSSSHYPFW